MKLSAKSPLIGIPACVRDQEGHPFHTVGEKYIAAVNFGAGGVPVLIPALGDVFDMADLVRRLDGLLVTGSPSNVAVSLYGGPPHPPPTPEGSQAHTYT